MWSTEAAKPGKYAKERRFGLLFPIGLAAAACLSWWRGNDSATIILAAVALCFIALALALPVLLLPFRFLAECLVRILGTAISWTVLSLFYWVILTPAALAWRLSGKDPMSGARPSWRDVPPEENDPESLKHLY